MPYLVPKIGTCYLWAMRVIARSTLMGFGDQHSDARPALLHWIEIVKASTWSSTADIQSAFPKAKVLNGERVRFEIAGGKYRLIAAFKFRSELCFVKFMGTHAEYDRIDALIVSQH
ncbi:MAG: type II toxin-antitoxin system HigB family toxin [Rhizobiaceae bacterium]